MELPRHAEFIIASYAVTVLLVGWMIVGTITAARRARRRLDALTDSTGKPR
jgi:heme exporter protein CcmD